MEQEFQTFTEAKEYAGQRGAVKRSSDDRYVYLGGPGTGIVDDRGILSIHRDPELKKRLTYVASGTRVQLLEFGEQTSRVSIAGVTGHVPTDRLRPFPAERVSNASYYQTKGDRLLHYIVADSGLGGLIVAGEATKTTPRTSKYVESKTLTRDLTKPTRLSAKQLDAFIKEQAPDSPLIGKGKSLSPLKRNTVSTLPICLHMRFTNRIMDGLRLLARKITCSASMRPIPHREKMRPSINP